MDEERAKAGAVLIWIWDCSHPRPYFLPTFTMFTTITTVGSFLNPAVAAAK